MNNSKVCIIAEIGQAHDGSLGLLHSYIDAISKSGADVAKFQMHIADAESSSAEPFRVPFSYEDKTRYDYWKRMEFTDEQWIEIKRHCEEVDLEFLASPFSVAAVRLLERLNVKHYKVASGETKNYLMLEHIAQTGKDIWISTGMSSINEIRETLEFINKRNSTIDKVLFQCTTAYPTPPEKIGLNMISELKETFNLPIGLSDHSGTIFSPLAAVGLGAKYIETHVVFDKQMFGPDSPVSLTFTELKQLVDGIRFIEQANENPVDKNNVRNYEELKTMFGKSLAISSDLSKGDVITLEHLESKKPANLGIPAESFETVIGKEVNRLIKTGEFLQWGDIE
jgi:N,N'-diacetyllegionaminate synthase